MQNVHFDEDSIIITNEIRRIISDLRNETNFSDLTIDEYYECELPISKRFS